MAGHVVDRREKRRGRLASETEREQMWQLHSVSKMSALSIARYLKKSYSTVANELKRRGVNLSEAQTKSKTRFKTMDADRERIKSLYEAGASLNALAQDYKCSLGAVKKALEMEGVSIRSRAQSHGVLFQDRLARTFCMRSSWEVKTAVWLDSQNRVWDYERESFLLPSGSSYTPDFWIYVDDQKQQLDFIIDVKGYARPEQISRIEEFRAIGNPALFFVWGEAELRDRKILDIPLPELANVGSRCRTPQWKLDALLDAYLHDGLTMKEAGARVGLTESGAGHHLRRLGLTRSSQKSKHRKSGRGPEWLNRLIELHRAGNSMSEIGRRLGVNSGTVHYHLEHAGIHDLGRNLR